MKVYPMVGEVSEWTPSGAGATVETLVSVNNALGTPGGIAQVPVRLTTSNEVTKSGQARTVIKLEARLNAQLYWGSTGATQRYNSVGANADIPVSLHVVASAPRGAIQAGDDSAGTNEGGLRGLFAFLFRTLVTIVTNRSANQSPAQFGSDWNPEMLLDALKGKTAYDPVSGSYGQASQG